MNLDYLDFEQPIAELEEKIEELRRVSTDQDINITDEINKLQQKSAELTRSIFAKLSDQQIVQLARHPKRPYTLDYIEKIFTEFDELHGDRHASAGDSIVGGLAKLDGKPVMVIGHQKGRTTKEKVSRNFGMASPEAFRKALRLMKLAEKFSLPIFTFIDTPGAYPGITAEEKNQSEAIARNLFEMAELKTPIIATVLGEGCSGGALALGVSDRTLMLQYSYYSVISPEGCASILWKSAEKAAEAAEALNLTAKRLLSLKLIQEVIEEPLGGAHRNPGEMAVALKKRLIANLTSLQAITIPELVRARQNFWMQV
ncbi:MAG: acetyl-CoA carboxylase carboxyltransferase subunit alpha [Gammaproteobacteria bacterium RIFCSPLOWO2_02_FULL_42_14]|nr:MAG: acetyl-CoA carboxylase carboxyltransferase subunit alpha [Gammaproteobacteria bacterium RIFCSPHIGHO2_02_FULL_42_43]OGT27767.1 MAG: acetyl-CoA carboxylase carboxyltransferase subunit alpha [Gammaproteobacteria bacterium RIFCSPHIGHO2_01_FULL_42_8]OGT52394.1 MAG: acetyl-CoA carboxylase carboxyltransferase subunit alpha [Gammaproteobacteria bacterium RIFCSPHIGHO2_12_FULL_41_25]OGT62478.1 MAG: acetyl-CoA carboxylase carboxyltransferase subunit alpha [Gammaproteobacteria bacterium RIFCSPLOWO2_